MSDTELTTLEKIRTDLFSLISNLTIFMRSFSSSTITYKNLNNILGRISNIAHNTIPSIIKKSGNDRIEELRTFKTVLTIIDSLLDQPLDSTREYSPVDHDTLLELRLTIRKIKDTISTMIVNPNPMAEPISLSSEALTSSSSVVPILPSGIAQSGEAPQAEAPKKDKKSEKKPKVDPPVLSEKDKEKYETKIKGYFDLDYELVRGKYKTKYESFPAQNDKIPFKLSTLVEDITKLMRTKEEQVKVVIGHGLFNYLEHSDRNFQSMTDEDQNNMNCIIPVGLPGSGKSFLMDKIFKDINKDTYVKCDADEIRDVIINLVLDEFFSGGKIPNETEATEMRTNDIRTFNEWIKIYKSLVDMFRNYIIWGVKDIAHIIDISGRCGNGVQAYCKPLIEYDDDPSLFFPQAFDIFLLFCKYKKLNFIYDATNTEPEFRYSLMMRCYLMCGYTKFTIWTLITPYNALPHHLDERNMKTIRETKMEFVEGKLSSLFKIDPLLLEDIDTNLKTTIETDNVEKSKTSSYLRNMLFPEYKVLLQKIFDKMYKSEESKYYGIPEKEFNIKFPFFYNKPKFTINVKNTVTDVEFKLNRTTETTETQGGSIFKRITRRSRRTARRTTRRTRITRKSGRTRRTRRTRRSRTYRRR